MIESVFSILNKLPHDKLLHFVTGLPTAILLLIVFKDWLIVCCAMGVLGCAKELYDARHPQSHSLDLWDAVATASSGAVVALIYGISLWIH